MRRRSLTAAAALAAAAALVAASPPPRGWNSYMSTGGAVDEATLLRVADYVAQHLAPFGYTLLILDEGWSEAAGAMVLDAYGRPYPSEAAYPSAAGGRGFAPLSAQLASKGLQLGLWVLRGVPRSAAAAATPIWQSNFSCDQAVRFDRPCFWNGLTYGVRVGAA